MKRYEIRCTESQTRKALELGAPIDNITHYASYGKNYISGNNIYDNGVCYFIPTAEKMIGWLEEQGFKFNIYEKFGNSWYYYVGHRTYREPIQEFDNLKSRQEATLAAIDAALEYLMSNKNHRHK